MAVAMDSVLASPTVARVQLSALPRIFLSLDVDDIY